MRKNCVWVCDNAVCDKVVCVCVCERFACERLVNVTVLLRKGVVRDNVVCEKL